jgi:hypothetical protein
LCNRPFKNFTIYGRLRQLATDLQAYLRHWLDRAPPPKGSLRLSVDVDPYSFM